MMMMMRLPEAGRKVLYGALSSSRTNKVMWIAKEAALSFTHITTPTKELKTDPAYIALNPKGTVPTWVEHDDGAPQFVINESNTIVAYIAQVYGEQQSLFPQNARDIALGWQWQEYGETSVQPACSPVWWGYMYAARHI